MQMWLIFPANAHQHFTWRLCDVSSADQMDLTMSFITQNSPSWCRHQKRALDISCWRRPPKHSTSHDRFACLSFPGSFDLSVLFLHLKCLFFWCRHQKRAPEISCCCRHCTHSGPVGKVATTCTPPKSAWHFCIIWTSTWSCCCTILFNTQHSKYVLLANFAWRWMSHVAAKVCMTPHWNNYSSHLYPLLPLRDTSYEWNYHLHNHPSHL